MDRKLILFFLTGRREYADYLKNVGGIINLVLEKPISAQNLIEAIRSRVKQLQVIYA